MGILDFLKSVMCYSAQLSYLPACVCFIPVTALFVVQSLSSFFCVPVVPVVHVHVHAHVHAVWPLLPIQSPSLLLVAVFLSFRP